VAAELSWLARNAYIYIERDEDRRLDSAGRVQSQNVDITKLTLIHSIRFEELMEHNGQLPSDDDQKKRDADIGKLKHETTAEQAERLRKDQDNRSFLRVLLDAFDFRLVGDVRSMWCCLVPSDIENTPQNTRPSWKNHLWWPVSPTLPPTNSGPITVSARMPAATSFGNLLSFVAPYIFANS
jgi:hypothetical protein